LVLYLAREGVTGGAGLPPRAWVKVWKLSVGVGVGAVVEEVGDELGAEDWTGAAEEGGADDEGGWGADEDADCAADDWTDDWTADEGLGSADDEAAADEAGEEAEGAADEDGSCEAEVLGAGTDDTIRTGGREGEAEAEVTADEVGEAEVTGLLEAGTDEAGTDEAGTDEAGTDEAGVDEGAALEGTTPELPGRKGRMALVQRALSLPSALGVSDSS
jgi:hypothetical protein